MKFTYIKGDKIIGIGDEITVFYQFDTIDFDPEVDAIQWYNTWGEIEYTNRQEKCNEKFEDISYIQPLIDLWNQKDEEFKIVGIGTTDCL